MMNKSKLTKRLSRDRKMSDLGASCAKLFPDKHFLLMVVGTENKNGKKCAKNWQIVSSLNDVGIHVVMEEYLKQNPIEFDRLDPTISVTDNPLTEIIKTIRHGDLE